ncbi:hypothetical protein ACH41E_23595 [Streptomyces sp. NPDC020412]|uniref:hypothetical protein n=1 Tax=Streptomyces sp. NPDC020412 TaxID=3365073 RepID=UPI003789853F
MQPERTNGTSGEALAIPMAWLCAEYIADEVLRTGDLVDAGTLEYRAGRQTLALTVYLCDGADEVAGVQAVARIEEWLNLTSYDHPWAAWVDEQLAAREERAREAGRPAGPDLALARESWRWLRQTELFATDLGEEPPRPATDAPRRTVNEDARSWTPAWQLGLPLSHLAIHLF